MLGEGRGRGCRSCWGREEAYVAGHFKRGKGRCFRSYIYWKGEEAEAAGHIEYFLALTGDHP